MSRTVTVPNLSVEDFQRFRAAQKDGRSDDLAARDVLRRGLDSLDAERAAEAEKALKAKASKKAAAAAKRKEAKEAKESPAKKKAKKKKTPKKAKVTLDAAKPETLED